MYNYQYSLRALISSIPEPHETKLPKNIATVGFSEIWPCLDGAVVPIYQSLSNNIEIEVKQPTNKTVNSFLRHNKVTTLYDQQGNNAPISFNPELPSVLGEIFHFVPLPLIENKTKKEYSPRYQHLIIFGWDALLPEPDQEALTKRF
jgi:hypothetical protein